MTSSAGEAPRPETPHDPDPIAEWAAAYDDALMRGEPPPGPAQRPGDPADRGEGERLRDLLHMLHHALRSPGTGSGPVVREEPSATEDGLPPLGRFVVERELGRGGCGVVYLAYDPAMDRRVALKVPCADALLDPGVRRRFLREARAAARLDHPNLVPMYEADEVGPICYIASAYCEGPTLSRWLAERPGPIEPRQAARLARTMALAVAHVHGRGLIHGDLKPGNILLEPPPRPGDDPVPRITDFGLARLIDPAPDATAATRPMGTPPYMAPEQIEPPDEGCGPQADVYAMGAILYQLLTGRPPHKAGSPWQTMRAVLVDPPVPPRQLRPGLPRDLQSICLKCLEKSPGSRYETAAALAEDLGRYLDGRPTSARPLGPTTRTVRWARRHPAAAALIGMGLLTLLLVSAAAVALVHSNRRLARAGIATRQALDAARRERYVATLALAQQDARGGRIGLAQRRLRALIPGPDERDERDFAWSYLYRQTRHERTTLGELMPGPDAFLSAADGLVLGATVRLGFWDYRPPDPSGSAAGWSARPSFRFRPGPAGIRPESGGVLSPDGRLAIVDRRDARGRTGLIVLDPHTGRVRGGLDWPGLVPSGDGRSFIDGRRIVVAQEPHPGAPRRLEPRTVSLDDGGRLDAVGVPDIHSPAPSADGRRLFALRLAEESAHSRRLEAWDLDSGRIAWSRDDEEVGPALAVSPRPGGPVATATLDGRVQLRDPADGSIRAELPGHMTRVYSLAFSPDGRTLVSGADRRAGLWDVAGRTPIGELQGLGGWVVSAAFLPGTPDVALGIGQGQVVVWHTRPLSDPVLAEAHREEVWGLAYSPDGRSLATVGGDKAVHLRDAVTGCVVRTMGSGPADWPSRLAYAPDGRTLAVADFGGSLRVWDADTGQVVRSFRAHASRAWVLAYSPDGRVLATGGRDRMIRLWDAEDWRPIATLSGHDADVRDLAFFPDGRTLASIGADATVALWDLRSGGLAARWRAAIRATCVAVSPDGSILAAGEDSGGLTLWDTATGAMRARLGDLQSDEISDLAFTPDGRVLAVAGQDRVITLVDVATGQPHLTLLGHTGGVNRVAFSPDGQTLASASHDHSVRLWRAGEAGGPIAAP